LSVRHGLSDFAIRVLPDPGPVREKDILLSIRKLNSLNSGLLDPLDGSIWEDGLLFSIVEDAFNRAVRETKRY
jgi:hypothetical protein